VKTIFTSEYKAYTHFGSVTFADATHINQINDGTRQVNSATSIVAGPPISETAGFTVVAIVECCYSKE
jgi:hypothetical protein